MQTVSLASRARELYIPPTCRATRETVVAVSSTLACWPRASPSADRRCSWRFASAPPYFSCAYRFLLGVRVTGRSDRSPSDDFFTGGPAGWLWRASAVLLCLSQGWFRGFKETGGRRLRRCPLSFGPRDKLGYGLGSAGRAQVCA
jgi:hypothetical protein